MGTPDAEIDVTMRVEPWVSQRLAAWDCHRSQHNPNSFTATMPDEMRAAMAANEQFVLAAARSPLPDGVTDDLLAGLEREMQAAAGASAAELAAHVSALRGELAVSRTLADVLQAYLRTSPEPKQAQLYRRQGEGLQEITYRLAHALRVAGEPAAAIEADVKLRQRGQRQESGPERLAFLRGLVESAVARFQVQARHAATPYQKAVWEELAVLMQAQAETIVTAAG